MADTFIVSPSSATGNVFLTEFTFQSLVTGATSHAWDFGDTIYSYESSIVSHIYRYPGTYTVSGSAWFSDDTAPIVSQENITVDYVYPNKVTFAQYPESYGVPGERTSTPFVVSLTCTEIQDSLYLTLQSLNTNSIPNKHVPSKWQFITPTWRFVDATTNETIEDGVLVKTSPIFQTYNGTSHIVAVTGEATFYYIDDSSTNFIDTNSSPILLIATLSTENFVYPPDSQVYDYNSYANSDAAKAAALWQVNNYGPTNLKVTENFISDIYPTKWTSVPIPLMITPYFDSRTNQNFANTPVLTANILEYPRTNDIGSMYPVNIALVSNTTQTIDVTSSAAFSNVDSKNNITSGYVYTTITPTTTGASTIVATMTCVEPLAVANNTGFNFPYGYPIYSDAYVYNPYSSTLNRVRSVNCPHINDSIQYYRDLGVLSDGSLNVWSLPTPTMFETATSQTSSSAPLYGIAFDPIKNTIYACDSLNQTIVALDQSGNLKGDAVNLFYTLGAGGTVNPCCISVDANHNIWLSFYNKETIVELDSNLNVVRQITPSTYTSNTRLVAPPMVETDSASNVWSCFAETSSSRAVKFDSQGSEIYNIVLPASSVPVSLAVDANDSVWIACYNSNLILTLSANGTTINKLSGDFTRPNHIAVDRSNNIWFTHGYNFISKYDSTAASFTSWQIDTLSAVAYLASESTPVVSIPVPYNEMWSGLNVDVYDRVWAIDSKTNNLIMFNAFDPANVRVIATQPALSTIQISLPTPLSGIDVPTSHIHSTQAVGDWTGNRWYQKYATPIYTAPISGTSASFNVFELDGTYGVSKVNEEFDISAYFQSLALPDSLSQNDVFFQEFLAAVAGDGNPTTESAGRIIYERIANFVQTHGDFETSEINQLLSYAAQLSVDAKTYGINFPAEVSRLLNLFSIPKRSLRGRMGYDPSIKNSIGSELTTSDSVSAGQYIFARDIKSINYQLIYITALEDGTTVYPLSSLSVAGLNTPLCDNYYFFEYAPSPLGYTENIINWDSIYTTFDYTMSSNKDWYGDNGLIETMFNNILTKRLTE